MYEPTPIETINTAIQLAKLDGVTSSQLFHGKRDLLLLYIARAKLAICYAEHGRPLDEQPMSDETAEDGKRF